MSPEAYRFGHALVRPAERLVLVDGQRVALGARAFDVLLMLLENRDRLVTKDELLDRVWEGLVVEENNLQTQVSALRKLLGPSSIATIPGRGYRFAQRLIGEAPAEVCAEVESPQAQSRTNVPVAADLLIGRALALQELCTSLTHARLVSTTGAGGIGKTRLAQAASRAVVSRYRDGVWWVDLAALSSSDKVVPAIAKAAQLRLGEGESRTELVRALGDRALLIVLDNCEHLSNAVAEVVSAVLAGTENVRVLTTSQAALKVRGESVYRLEPLDLPPLGASLADARTYGAVQLLEARAIDLDRRFNLTERNVAQAIDLCRKLDGIALAIEMAAARVPLLGLARLREQLGDRLDLLRASCRDSSSRHKSLRLTIDWSYSLLNVQEKTLLRRLSAFVGSFRIDVAQLCALSEELDGPAVLDALEGLVDKSLVKLEQLEPPRYRLLETTRVYAREQLARAGETDAVLRKHGEALARLAEWAIRDQFVLSTEAWLDEYLPDYDDLAEAFDRAFQRRDADVAAATVDVLRAVDQHRTLSASSSRIARAIELLPCGSPIGQARLFSFIASCGWITVPQVSRVDCARQAVDLWRMLGDSQELYGTLCVCATESARIGAYDAAEDALREARNLEGPAWPPRRILRRMIHEGWVAYFRCDSSRSRDAMRQAMALASKEGERDLAASARTWLGAMSLMAGDVEESIEHSRAAVVELRALDQREYLAFALTTLGSGLLLEQDLAGAAGAASDLLADRCKGDLCPNGALLLVALLAARMGDGASSATLLGAAEARSAEDFYVIKDRMYEDAAESVIGLIGPTEASRLRQAGVLMRNEEANELAKETLCRLMNAAEA